MKKTTNAKTKKLAGIIKNAQKQVDKYLDEIATITDKIATEELKGNAIVTFNRGERHTVNNRSLEVLSWHFAQKQAMLQAITGGDVFADVEGATNAAKLSDEIQSIILYKRSLKKISDLKDEKSDIQHAYHHLSSRLSRLESDLVKMELGADVLDDIEV